MQIFLESALFFWLNVLIFPVGRYADIKSSTGGHFYGLTEGIKFSRDKDGRINVKKNVLGSGVFLAIGIACAMFLAPFAGLMIIAPLGFYSFFQTYLNYTSRRRGRENQIKTLRSLHRGDEVYLGFLTTRNGKSYYKLFPWIYVTGLDVDSGAAQLEVQRLIVAHSHRPESEWFPA